MFKFCSKKNAIFTSLETSPNLNIYLLCYVLAPVVRNVIGGLNFPQPVTFFHFFFHCFLLSRCKCSIIFFLIATLLTQLLTPATIPPPHPHSFLSLYQLANMFVFCFQDNTNLRQANAELTNQNRVSRVCECF